LPNFDGNGACHVRAGDIECGNGGTFLETPEHAMSAGEPDLRADQRFSRWYFVLGACAMIGAGLVCWNVAEVLLAPSTEEAMARSLAELDLPELKTAYSLHPDTCSITKTTWQWSVQCTGVPNHYYQDITVCDPGPPKTCGAMPSDYVDCRTYFWDIDLNGKPSDPIGQRRGLYGSMWDDCKPRGTLASDREEMARRGMALNHVEMLDLAGAYTGKPRLPQRSRRRFP
jgi:hypothetical protein